MEVIIRQLVDKKLSDSDASILMNAFNAICQNIEWSMIFNSDNDFINIIMPYIKGGKLETQIPALEIVKTVSHHTPDWVHPLISTLVSHTSITHAELAGLPYVPIYTPKLIPDVLNNYDKDDYKKSLKCINQVNMLAHSLALVFSSVNHSLKGVPIKLSNSSFNAAKAMILGNFQTEDDEEDIISVNLSEFDITDSPRREAGWILLEGLLHLGNQWVGFKVTTIYKLWNSVFCKDMWEIDVDRIKSKDVNYLEKILIEFKIKKQALSSIKWFLNKCFILLNSQLIKLVSGFLINATTFFISQEKKEIATLFRTTFSEDFMKVRSDLYECLSNLHPSLYSGKFVHILHSVAEDISNETLSKIPPSICYKFLSKEDELDSSPYLHTSVPSQLINEDFYYDSSSTIQSELLDLTRRHSPWLITDNSRMEVDKYPLLASNNLHQMGPSSINSNPWDISDVDVRMSLRNNSIQIFSDVFLSSQLNSKNKVVLSSHLLQHVKSIEETMVVNKKSKKAKQKESMSKERKISKLISIASAAYMVAVGLVKKKYKEIDKEVFENIESILLTCLNVENQFLNRICAEGLVLLYKQLTTPEYMISTIEITMAKLDEEVKAGTKSVTNIQKHVYLLGNILRHTDMDKTTDVKDSLLQVFINLSKTANSVLRQYVMHFLSMNDQEEFFTNTYPICFHQMQTDILPELFITNSMWKFTERILRHFQFVTDIQSKCIIVFKEFINHGLLEVLEHFNHAYLVNNYLKLAKTVLILQDKVKKDGRIENLPLTENEIYNITKIVVQLLQKTNNIHLKQTCVEIIATVLNLGDIETLEKLLKSSNYDEDFYCFLLDELNNTKAQISPFNSSKMRKKISSQPSYEHIIHNTEFERLINFNHNSLDSFVGNSKDYELFCKEYYEYSLEILFLYAMKISGHYKLDMWIKICRYFVSYKHMSLSTFLEKEEQKKEEENDDEPKNKKKDSEIVRNPNPLEYRLSKDLKDSTKEFLLQALTSFITNYATTDGHSKTDISKHISKLINIAFTAANIENNNLKKVGLSLIIELVKKFQYTEESVDKEDEETMKQMEEDLGLLIEQYEAQISSIIRQNIKSEVSPELQIKAFDLLYYFITVPISHDPEIIGRILGQIVKDLGSLNIHGEQHRSYDRIINEAHLEKLCLLSKLFLISRGEQMQKFYSIDISPKTMNEDKDLQNIINSRRHLKLKKEDKVRIKTIFSDLGIESILKRQLLSAIYDAYIVMAMPRSVVINHKRFVFLTSGMRSAYNYATIEKTTQYFMKCLVYLVDSKTTVEKIVLDENEHADASLKDIFENYAECKDHEMLMALIQYYLVAKIDQNEGQNNKSSVSHALYNHIKLRLFWIGLLSSLFKSISIEYECLKEIFSVFDKLSFLGIAEVDIEIIKVWDIVIDRINKTRNENAPSIFSSTQDQNLSDERLLDYELSMINLIQSLILKIMSQMQDFVSRDPTYKDIKSKLEDIKYQGLESNLLNASSSLSNEGESKLSTQQPTIVKNGFNVLCSCVSTILIIKKKWMDTENDSEQTYTRTSQNKIISSVQSLLSSVFWRFTYRLILCIKPFAKFYYTQISSLLEQISLYDTTCATKELNEMIFKLIGTIKVANSYNGDEEEKMQSKTSSGEDSEASDNFNIQREDSANANKTEEIKIKLTYIIQLLNKIVIHVSQNNNFDQINESVGTYLSVTFDTEEESKFDLGNSEITNLSWVLLRSLNSYFATDNQKFKQKLVLFSKYCFEEGLSFIFYHLQNIFKYPKNSEFQDQSKVLGISEAVKFVTNSYLNSEYEEKEVMIDPIVQLILGALVSVQECKARGDSINPGIINAWGEALYSISFSGDIGIVRNLTSTLSDNQKQLMQNVVKALAMSKKAQQEKEQKSKAFKGKVGQKAQKATTKLVHKISR